MEGTGRIAPGAVGALTAVAACIVALAFAASDAHALECGKTVKKDVKLKQNLLNCPGDGLIAGANDITIDLNGHRIDGTQAEDSAGIRDAGFEDVTVRGGGGRVTGFFTGLHVNADGTSAAGLEVRNVLCGVCVGDGADGVRVARVEIRKAAVWGVFTGSDTLIKRSEVRGAGVTGIAADGADARLVGNQVFGSGLRGILVPEDGGQRLRNNLVRRSGSSGILVDDDAGTGARLIGNRTHRNGDHGIEIEPAGVEVGDNRANYNDQWGIMAPPGTIDLGGNKAKGNGAGQCSGLAVFCG